MKQYTNSKGESLPKVICAVVEFENKRLKPNVKILKDSLVHAFNWDESTIFGNDTETNADNWNNIDSGHYESFYSIFPTCKNSRGQELPEEIQVEIVEERLRQWDKIKAEPYQFSWSDSKKGEDYWFNIWEHTDYTPTELPTKSDDTFTQGEIVEVSDKGSASKALWDYLQKLKAESEKKAEPIVGFDKSIENFWSPINKSIKFTPNEPSIQITDQKAREICAKYFNDCNPNEIKIV